MRRFDHSLLEGQALECVQGVVMDENADRTLHREQVRYVFYSPAQFIQARLIRTIIGAIASHQTAAEGRSGVRILRWKGRPGVELTASQIGHTYSTIRSAPLA